MMEKSTANGNPPIEFLYKLKGFSGSSVEVNRSAGKSFVRKKAAAKAQNDRLLGELAKLRRLGEIAGETGLFQVPEVLHTGQDGHGLAFYDLEFVPSWELGSHLMQLDAKSIHEMAFRVKEIIRAFASLSQASGGSGPDFIAAKLAETEAVLPRAAEKWPIALPLIAGYSRRLQLFSQSPVALPTQATFCHGDLALDNVLIARNQELYIIDPLTNGHETYLWDIAKVLQSSFLFWKQIKLGDFDLDLTKGKIVLEAHDRVALFNARFYEFIQEVCQTPELINLYLATTIARVVKYAQTRKQFCALLMLTNELLDRYLERRVDFYEPLSALRR